MTNRGWLTEQMQNMSDEELGEKIARTSEKCEFCLIEPEYECGTELRCCADEVKKWLKAEHKEKPKLKDVERVILENIPVDFEYIARNKDGYLAVYLGNPRKERTEWNPRGFAHHTLYCFNHLFQFIKWEDEKAYEIPKLLKGE